MRRLLILTVFLGSLAVGCQDSDLPQSSPISEASSPSTTTPVQTPQASSTSEAKPSTQPNTQLTESLNSERTCEISAYVIDTDPKGLNVRSGAGSNYKIIGNLPTTTAGVVVDLTASQGDWVQLTHAESPQGVEFQGTGWIYSQLLGTSTRGYGSGGVSVYKSANTQSATVGRIPEQTTVKLLSCDRTWALVEYKGLKGWIAPNAQCPSPFTTCS
ncbi:SH3 domain-containing protein [Microcoleus sp. FACHB-SPT15]|uniref:SH3 domain-containing protein n=1 Tax=Microcoleus sp. FACHB-SPT15 TaxID=2692830 RepID=UPI001783961A|nr:SH3 domain-containing protein [Microcoleus sp. FACHB-SPT15]MBD1807242.1 SH3 domain-containing protein [Microcoleus sp. FACHB-SPT15]